MALKRHSNELRCTTRSVCRVRLSVPHIVAAVRKITGTTVPTMQFRKTASTTVPTMQCGACHSVRPSTDEVCTGGPGEEAEGSTGHPGACYWYRPLPWYGPRVQEVQVPLLVVTTVGWGEYLVLHWYDWGQLTTQEAGWGL